MNDPLVIAGREFASRLFLGTGKFPSNEALRATIDALMKLKSLEQMAAKRGKQPTDLIAEPKAKTPKVVAPEATP